MEQPITLETLQFTTAPSKNVRQISPNNSVIYSPPLRRLFIGTVGNLVLKDISGNVSVHYGASNYIGDAYFTQVLSNGTDGITGAVVVTTATNIVGYQ